jgi:prepilin-type processing-associated H-X9-DG protein
LAELLVVLAIIAVVLGLSLTAVQYSRSAAQRAACSNNLRQIGLALHAYHDANNVLPPGMRRSRDPYPFLSWSARILPYIEQQALWERTTNDYARQPIFALAPPHQGLSTVLPVFVCPADGRTHGQIEPEGFDVAFSHYLGVAGNTSFTGDGTLYLDSHVRFPDISDGTSNTLMLGERPPSPDNRFGWWYAGVGQNMDGSADLFLGVADYRTTFRTPTCPPGPYSYRPGRVGDECDTFHFWSRHPRGAHFLMADGGVRFLPYSANTILPALATRSGGETPSVPD